MEKDAGAITEAHVFWRFKFVAAYSVRAGLRCHCLAVLDVALVAAAILIAGADLDLYYHDSYVVLAPNQVLLLIFALLTMFLAACAHGFC